MTTTKMSKTGAVTLPKAVRDAHGFEPGTEFEVIDGGRGITLMPVSQPPHSARKKLTVEEFLEMIPRYSGPPITDKMIEEAVLSEAKRRWDQVNRRWNENKDD